MSSPRPNSGLPVGAVKARLRRTDFRARLARAHEGEDPGPAQTGPAQTGPAQTGPAQTGPAQ